MEDAAQADSLGAGLKRGQIDSSIPIPMCCLDGCWGDRRVEMVYRVQVAFICFHTIAIQAVHPEVQQGYWISQAACHVIYFSLQAMSAVGKVVAGF